MTLMSAAASLVARRFLEAAGPVINVALLAGGSALLAEAMAAALVRRERLAATGMPLILVASAVAVTILLNPGFDWNVVLSSYADCGTMVAVGALLRRERAVVGADVVDGAVIREIAIRVDTYVQILRISKIGGTGKSRSAC